MPSTHGLIHGAALYWQLPSFLNISLGSTLKHEHTHTDTSLDNLWLAHHLSDLPSLASSDLTDRPDQMIISDKGEDRDRVEIEVRDLQVSIVSLSG